MAKKQKVYYQIELSGYKVNLFIGKEVEKGKTYITHTYYLEKKNDNMIRLYSKKIMKESLSNIIKKEEQHLLSAIRDSLSNEDPFADFDEVI